MDAVILDSLTHRYPATRRKSEGRLALDNVSFSVASGEIFCLLGPNGGGKSTLFKILSTFLKPTQGQAHLFGWDVVKESARVRGNLGVVFQSPSLDRHLTLRENLYCHGRLFGLTGDVLRRGTDDVLQRLGLLDRADDRVAHLSGGLARRGEVAKGLLPRPRLLLLDEPSTGLDPRARLELWDVLANLKKDGLTVLLTTHLMEEAEKADHLAILHQGKRVAVGSPAQLKGAIGGQVVTLETTDAEALRHKIQTTFGGDPVVLNGAVRWEKDKAHTLVPQLVEAFPGLVRAVTVGQPTLEDVFTHYTGRWFGEGEQA